MSKPTREFPRLCRAGSSSLTFTEIAVGVEVVQTKISNRRRILAWNGEVDVSRIEWRVLDVRLRKGPFEGRNR